MAGPRKGSKEWAVQQTAFFEDQHGLDDLKKAAAGWMRYKSPEDVSRLVLACREAAEATEDTERRRVMECAQIGLIAMWAAVLEAKTHRRPSEDHVCIGCGKRITKHPSRICGVCQAGDPHTRAHTDCRTAVVDSQHDAIEDDYSEEGEP